MPEICAFIAKKFQELVQILNENNRDDCKVQLIWIIYMMSKFLFSLSHQLAEIVCHTWNMESKKDNTENSNGNQKVDPQSIQLRGELATELFKFLTLLLKSKQKNGQDEVGLYEGACFHFLNEFVKVIFMDLNIIWRPTLVKRPMLTMMEYLKLLPVDLAWINPNKSLAILLKM